MNYDTQTRTYASASLSVYMRQVYLWMTAALGVTAAAAVFTASNPAFLMALFSSTMPVVILAVGVIGLSVFISARIHTLSSGT
ncbi:MAG: BAX inhibitor (BI)-1/YccA family protein, partial [Mailhella sp.]|nr:BAX inhibitor (BI)-1/YccA family protein [Mailhella sp.]